MTRFADLPMPPSERVSQHADLPSALRALGIRTGRPVLVVVGGADGMAPEHLAPLADTAEHVLRMLERWDGAIVDGGTDSGVMKVMGQARHSAGAAVPLIGVAAEGTVDIPGNLERPDAAELERHHSHVILVPGDTWGDESPWLSTVATAIANGRPSLTLVINGGQITYDDIDHSLKEGRPVVVLAGTGRTADAIAAAASGNAPNAAAARIAASADTRIVPLNDPRVLYSTLESILAPRHLAGSATASVSVAVVVYRVRGRWRIGPEAQPVLRPLRGGQVVCRLGGQFPRLVELVVPGRGRGIGERGGGAAECMPRDQLVQLSQPQCRRFVDIARAAHAGLTGRVGVIMLIGFLSCHRGASRQGSSLPHFGADCTANAAASCSPETSVS